MPVEAPYFPIVSAPLEIAGGDCRVEVVRQIKPR